MFCGISKARNWLKLSCSDPLGRRMISSGSKQKESTRWKETPIEHFNPNIVTIIHSSLTNSPIQQASPNSTQVVSMNEDRIKELKELIQKMNELHQEPSLKLEEKNDLQAEIQTIQGQLSSSQPKTKIITESITSARTILEGVSSTCAAASLLITRINMWLHGIT